MEEKIITLPVNPETFEYQEYETQDVNLITLIELDTAFSESSDYIEYHVYNINKELIYPLSSDSSYTLYNIKQGDILVNPSADLIQAGFNQGSYFVNYSFYRERCNTNSQNRLYISEISSDRTELRLDTNTNINDFSGSINDFIEYREEQNYFVDFYLNFGNNKTVIANNIELDDDEEESTILIKLYEPLPEEFDIKSQLWIVEELNTSQAYKVEFPEEIIEVRDYEFIKGPNYNIKVIQEVGEASETVSFSTLLSTPQTSSLQQLNSLLSDKGININVDYEKFEDFVKFSSALTRLENFYYKVKVIENTQNKLDQFINPTSGATTATSAFSASKASLETTINSTIENFDGYEYFLYFNSGSKFSWPKSTSTIPYKLHTTGSTDVINWLGSANESLSTYGGVALSASNYDEINLDRLHDTIPEYLVEDSNNQNYELFIDMIAQHFDNIWLYTKDVTNRFNADNRLDYGISKDLVADAIREFGIKVYQNNYGTEDLFAAFLGITPSGSSFPISNITGSSPQEGQEIVTTQISGSNDIIPLNDVNSRIYKKLYHNLPFLLKSKGTMKGVKALLSILGIPSTILDIKEFGGRIKESTVYDQPEEIFNRKLKMDGLGNGRIITEFVLNSKWGSTNNVPANVMFRFQTQEVKSSGTYVPPTQSLFELDGNSILTLEYNSGSLASGSYSGSIPSPTYQYGSLKLQPAGITGSSTSISAPFFDGGWWSVMVNYTHGAPSTYTLYAANKSSDYQLTQQVGFNATASIVNSPTNWINSTAALFGWRIGGSDKLYLTGSLQEIRYYTKNLSEKTFHDYVLNPSSIQGTTTNSAPEELAFRGSLGGELFTSSISIHPKSSGIWATTSSFASQNAFNISSSNYIPNVETVSKNQVPSGIRTSKASKIQVVSSAISTGDTLSTYRSIQQDSSLTSKDPDVKYVETTLSPQSQIDKDIISQIGYFNLGDYIGDVREMDKTGDNYPDLDRLRNSYFEKYTKSYDLVDFVRLVNFFDNSLFKMIENFSPSDVSLTSGVVVKQHLLERNRIKRVIPTTENITYSGSTGQIESLGGGTGGSFERFQTSGSQYYLTQSWSEVVQTLDGPLNKVKNDQSEFYTGEFGNQFGTDVSTLETNVRGVDCSRFLNPKYSSAFTISPVFLTTSNYSKEEFLSDSLSPVEGVAWLWVGDTGVEWIKISNTSKDGSDITSFLGELTQLSLNLTNPKDQSGTTQDSGVYTWTLENTVVKSKFTSYKVKSVRPYNVVGADNSIQTNFNFSVTGDMIWHASSSGTPANPVLATGVEASTPQGYFPSTTSYPTEQYFRGWNGALYLEDYNDYIDTRGTKTGNFQGFNVGAKEISRADNLRWEDVENTLSTLPWFMIGKAGFRTQTLFADLNGQSVRPIKLVAIKIITNPIENACGYMLALSNVGGASNTNFIAVRHDTNADKFTEKDGVLVIEDKTDSPNSATGTDILFEETPIFGFNDSRYQWHEKSIIQAGAPLISLPTVSDQNRNQFPIEASSIENGKQAFLTYGFEPGKFDNIKYCAGVFDSTGNLATWNVNTKYGSIGIGNSRYVTSTFNHNHLVNDESTGTINTNIHSPLSLDNIIITEFGTKREGNISPSVPPPSKPFSETFTTARNKVYAPSEGNTSLSKLQEDIYLSKFTVSQNSNGEIWTYNLYLHGKNNPPPAGIYTIRITRRYNGVSFPIGTHPYGGTAGVQLLTNEYDYDWKLTIPSVSYDTMILSKQPYVWSSINEDGNWRSSNRFITNADYNKDIASVLYQNTALHYNTSTNQIEYTGIWYKAVDTKIKSSTPNLNERGGGLIPNSPNPSSFLIPSWVYNPQHVQGEGDRFTTAPPSNGDGYEIVITDYEP